MRSYVMRSALLMAMTLTGVLSAAETALVSHVKEFKDVYIEGATKSFVEGPTKDTKALHIVVETQPAEEWLAQTWVRPLSDGVQEGDTVIISFRARSVDGDTATVKTSVGLGDAPWTTVVGEKLELTKQWKKYEVKKVASQAMTAEEARFGFIFGFRAQTFEIADLKVVKVTK